MTIPCPLTLRLEGDWGLIHMHLRAEGQTLHLQLSDLFDPLPAVYAWLEAIVHGLPRCGWWLHEADAHFTEIESQLIGRDVRDGQTLAMCRLRIEPQDDRPAFVLELSRRELVSTFYLGLREFDRDHLMRLLNRDMTGHCNNGLPWRLMDSPMIEQWLAQPQSGWEVDACPWLPPGWPSGAWRLRSNAVPPAGCSG